MKIMKLASEMRDSFFAIIRANTAATVSEANDASLKIINTLIAETKETADEITRLRAALLKLTDHFNNGDTWGGDSRWETIQSVQRFALKTLKGGA